MMIEWWWWMMMMDDDDNDADDRDMIHVTYIKAWAAGVGASSLKVLIYDVSVSLNSSIMNMMMMDVSEWIWW